MVTILRLVRGSCNTHIFQKFPVYKIQVTGQFSCSLDLLKKDVTQILSVFFQEQYKCVLLAIVTSPIFQEIYYFHQKMLPDRFKIFFLQTLKRAFFFPLLPPLSLSTPTFIFFKLFSQLLPAKRHSAHLRSKHRQTEVTDTVCERREICSFMQDNYFFCFPLSTLSDDNSSEGENCASSGSDSILECHFAS